MGKINYVCEFGVIHSTAQCRCMDSHVTKRQVKCDRPDDHRPTSNQMTLRERLEITVDEWIGKIMSSEVRRHLLDKLEQDVKDWLSDNSKNI